MEHKLLMLPTRAKLTATLISLIIFFLTASHAQALELYPRLSYAVSASESKNPDTLIGSYIYFGAVAFEKGSGELQIKGPSLRYGAGKTGNKVNLNWFNGNAFVSTEYGLSYYMQNQESNLLINAQREGFALEAAFRFGILSIQAIATENLFELEYTFGF